MCESYRVSQGDKIILVGEGNFSFSKDFVILNECILSKQFGNIQVLTTCRESNFESFTKLKQNNINFIREKGITVIFNVDATNLKAHPEIQQQTYNKVIFNFPHVGGKMKIHLNRELLKDFFSSACDVLDNNGSVIVALCDGQGGTKADKKQRSWNDSWQITEMAAQSDLLLHRTEPFDLTCFPHYVNVGYRSMDKSFHCENAVVHIFKKHKPPRILQENLDICSLVNHLKEDAIFDFLNDSLVNPFSEPLSASSYVYDNLKEKLGQSYNIHEHVLKYNSYPILDMNSKPHVCSNVKMKSILDNLISIHSRVKLESIDSENIIVRVLMNCRPIVLKDFSMAPVRCQMMVFGFEASSSLFNHLSSMLILFNSEWHLNLVELEDEICKSTILISCENLEQNEKSNISLVDSLILPSGILCHVVHLDEVAKIIFRLDDWRSLWDGYIQPLFSEYAIFHPTSLFPRTYSFDLGLSVPCFLKEGFEDKLFFILWLVAGDIIINAELLSTYLPTDRDLICYCYRISYRSCNAPLHRKRVIYIHEHIIANIVSRVLNVNIT